MKKIKKLIALTLLIATCFTLSAPCFAIGNTMIDATALKTTETAGIFEASNGRYVMESNGEYFLMEKTDIDLSNESAVNRVLLDNDLPIEVRENIKQKYDDLKASGLADDVTLTLYEDMGLYQNLNTRGVGSPVYKTYDGLEMKSIITSWTGRNQPTVKIYDGKKAYTSASTLIDILMIGGNFVKEGSKASKILAAFGAGKTLWQAYKEVNPGIIKTTASNNDFVELNFTYDFYQKFVYVYSDFFEDWQHALEAEKVVIKNPYIRACYVDDNGYSGGSRVLQIIGKVVTWESESYSDPWKMAHTHMFLKRIESLDAVVGDYEFVFGDFTWE